MKVFRWVAGVGLLAVLVAGCGAGTGDDYVGRWESTSSDAWIEIHDDMTFEAHDVGTGVVPGGECDVEADVDRSDWSGTIYTKTLDEGFLYADGVQLWTDRSITGHRQLVVWICLDETREVFKR